MQNPIVLVVDDDEDICLLLSQIFKLHKIESYTANSLETAKHELSRNMPTHIFLDKKLPDGSGLDFMTYLSERYPDVKVILSTGYYEEIDDIYLTGISDVLRKPFTLDVVREKIQNLV